MKRIFLTSSINIVAKDIARKIGDVEKLKTAFIDTAAEPKGERKDLDWLKKDRKGLVDAGFNLTDYTITGKTPAEINGDLAGFDIIHVNGGNNFYLLLQAKKSGFDKFIKKFVEKGGIYIGSSAGSIVAAPDIEPTKKLQTKMYEEQLDNFQGFKIVDFLVLPHWGSEHFKDLYLNHRMDVAYSDKNKIILLTDYQYVYVENNILKIIDIRD